MAERFGVVVGSGSLRGPGLEGGELERLLARVDEVAEIPRVIRAGGGVRRR